MSEYPKIDSPCPIKWDVLPEPGNSFCQHCRRHVHNLSAMSIKERKRFMKSCGDSVCVAYAIKPKLKEQKIVWAAAMAASVMVTVPGLAAAACDPISEVEEFVVVMGGVKDPANAQWSDERNVKPPELPIIYDSEFDNTSERSIYTEETNDETLS